MDIDVTLSQVNPNTGDIEGNTNRIVDSLERAEQDGSDVVVFPEMAITGYCIRDLIEDETFVDENRRALDYIRRRTGDTAVVVGVIDRDDSGVYNAAAVLQKGTVEGIARKVLLPNYRYFDDARYFEAGEDIDPIQITVGGERVSLGVTVCEDMWDEEYDHQPITELADAGADLLININASPFEAGKRQTRHEIIQRHIEQTGLPLIYVNTVGVADVEKNILVFDGDSLAYAADGTLLAKAAQFAEDSVHVTVRQDDAVLSKSQSHPHSDSHSQYTPTTISMERREKELYDALVMGVRDYTRKTGFKKILEPISGGIDSSLGLAICVDALGPGNVIAFNLPSRVNTETTKSIAQTLADNFGVEYRTIPIQTIYEEILDTYEQHYDDIDSETAKENVYARVRGLFMMLVANDSPADEPAMLVSNGNETEMALGYVTLYGDMDGGLDILGDLSKMEVYDVARYVNERHAKELIPAETFEIEPSAELAADQVDPFDYSTVAPIVDDLLENRVDPAELVAQFETEELDSERYRDRQGRSVYDRYTAEAFEEIVYDTYNRLTRSTFKRVQAPPIIAVSSRAFGTDFREPIINKWDGRPLDWDGVG